MFLRNRSIANVITHPRAYIRRNVDVTLSRDARLRERQRQIAGSMASAAIDRFPRTHRAPPEIMGQETASSGRTYIRIKFRLWPGRGGPIETTFKQELLAAFKEIDPAYADWMVAENFEVEKETVANHV